ncbi:hypothetical protein NXT08_00635 [Rhodococcus pyridinivorans]|uniref:SbmA/BacA-like family transporter n=1 Tax=Rhodococcus TaxID=1827 RepID=UPI00214C959E|nr:MULTISPECIES: SbmA/BacA-like family transporter [Rhodococcus]UVT25219.1 hypothetical protein NXT08_00635 [Rhodococcus pyridinivorans]
MLDSGTVVVDSVMWTAKAFVITALVFVAVVAALVRFTGWGRQWWRIAASFFEPRHGAGGLALAAIVLLLTVFAVWMSVLFSYWYNDFYTVIQNRDEFAFRRVMRIFAIPATSHVVRALVGYLLALTLDIRWRTPLNERLVDDWFDSGSFYKDRFVSSPVGNPDQRIQLDITNLVTTTRVLSMGAVTDCSCPSRDRRCRASQHSRRLSRPRPRTPRRRTLGGLRPAEVAMIPAHRPPVPRCRIRPDPTTLPGGAECSTRLCPIPSDVA